MGAIIGVVIGYALGTRAGPEGWEELRESWKVISTSEEVRDLVGGGLSVTRDLLSRASEMLAGSLGSGASGSSGAGGTLRPVA